MLDLLGSLDIFKDFPIWKSRQVVQCYKKVEFGAGDVILKEGEKGDHFYIIQKGVVELKKTNGPRKLYTVGDYFGEMSLFCPEPELTQRQVTAVCSTFSELLAEANMVLREALSVVVAFVGLQLLLQLRLLVLLLLLLEIRRHLLQILHGHLVLFVLLLFLCLSPLGLGAVGKQIGYVAALLLLSSCPGAHVFLSDATEYVVVVVIVVTVLQRRRWCGGRWWLLNLGSLVRRCHRDVLHEGVRNFIFVSALVLLLHSLRGFVAQSTLPHEVHDALDAVY